MLQGHPELTHTPLTGAPASQQVLMTHSMVNKQTSFTNTEMSSPKINPAPCDHTKRHSSRAIVSSRGLTASKQGVDFKRHM